MIKFLSSPDISHKGDHYNSENHNSKMINDYKENVLKLNSVKSLSVEEMVMRQNLVNIRIAAMAVFFISVYWLLIDLFHNGSLNIASPISLIALVIQNVSSLYILSLSFAKVDGKSKFVRFSFLVYYLCIVAGILLLTVSKNITITEANAISEYNGISISSFYMFLMVFAPLYSKIDSAVLGISIVAAAVLPAILPGREGYAFASQVIVDIWFMVAYLLFRRIIIKSQEKEISLYNSRNDMMDLSLSDSLTYALNRRALDRYWNFLCCEGVAKTAGVIIFDIDNFKSYNDRYTHSGGDKILQDIGRRVCDYLYSNGYYLFRFGGEEFVAVMPDATIDLLKETAVKINRIVWDANIERNDIPNVTRLTVTVGCALEEVGPDAAMGNHCITNADKQLYLGKRSNKNCVMYENEPVSLD